MKRVAVLLCEGVELLEAAAFCDVLGWAGTYGRQRISLTTVGLTRRVRGAFGVHLHAAARLAEVDAGDFDALAVPGGFETWGFYRQAYAAPVLAFIRAFHAQKKPIASICVGALPLARSGILHGRTATTYHLGRGAPRRKQLAAMGVDVLDQPVVRDGHIITSTSPATATEVAFLLLERLTDKKQARHIRHLMGFRSFAEGK